MELKMPKIPFEVWLLVIVVTFFMALPYYINYFVRTIEPTLLQARRIEAQATIYQYQAEMQIERLRKQEE